MAADLRRPETPAYLSETEAANAFLVPFRLASPAGVLGFISTTTVFGTPIDVTLSEFALESSFPPTPPRPRHYDISLNDLRL